MMNKQSERPKIGLVCSDSIRRQYIDELDLERLEEWADFSFEAFEIPGGLAVPVARDLDAEKRLALFAAQLEALIVCHGAPFVSQSVLDAAPLLTMLGELEGDRFAYRLDIAAALDRGIRVVDTSYGSSWPTAEWALALALIGLRNAGALFRRLVSHERPYAPGIADRSSGPGFDGAELSHKSVGMIGFGALGRRLVELLRPFDVRVIAHDPFAARELAQAYDVAFAPLEVVLRSEVVFCLVPLTPGTDGMLGATELEELQPGSVFVNVSRGRIVDSEALISRLRRADVIACLDVFDPEPIPLDSPVLDLPNVFLSPHIGGWTEESRRRFFHLMVDECQRHFRGLEPICELTSTMVGLRNLGGGRRGAES